jgi:hypothetical protein
MVDNVTIVRRLFPRLVTIAMALAGLVFLAVGGGLLYSQTWSRATGTVGTCTTQYVRDSSGPQDTTTGHWDQMCAVTWVADGQTHSTTIDLGAGTPKTGQSVDLRVDGDTVAVATPVWIGVVCAGLGVVLLGVAVTRVIKRRRVSPQ